MTMMTISASDSGSFDAYLAKPAHNNPAPAVIVIQEIFGVNAEVRGKCDAWAEKGYIAIAPDLFWRQERGVQLTDKTEAEWQKAFALLNGFNVDLGVVDLISALNAVRALPNCTGNVGTVGYCLGGRLAYLMATRSTATCNVSYYGVTIENYLHEARNIKTPLMLHLAEEDKYVPKAAQAKIKTALGTNSYTTLHSYAGVDHAFSRTGGQHYDEAAASLANARTAEFMAKHLNKNIVI